MSSSAWVTKILNSLPVEYRPKTSDARNKLEIAANEKLRSLGIKIRHAGKNDSEQARAAIVLEHVLRKSWHHFHAKPVSLEILLTPIGMKKKQKKAMANLQPMFSDALDQMDRGRAPITSTGGRIDTSSVRAKGLETIRDLSIRLGTMLSDPDGTAKRAELLLSAIIKHMNGMKRHLKMDSLNDLQRNGKEYAAGCFLLSANSDSSTDTKKASMRGQESDEEETEERKVTPIDIIYECKLAEKQALHIFKSVADLSKEITLDEPKDESKASKKRKRDHAEKKNESRILASTSSEPGRQGVSKHILQEEQLSTFIPSEDFKKWKLSVLNQARKNARAAMPEEHGSPPDRISDDQAIERAAVLSLRQHGF